MLPGLPLLLQSKPNSNSVLPEAPPNPEPSRFHPGLTLRAGALIIDGQETFNPSVTGSLYFGRGKIPGIAYSAFGATVGCEGHFGDSRTAGGVRIGPKAIYQVPLSDGVFSFFSAELSFTAGGGELFLPIPGAYHYSGGDLVLAGGLNYLSLYLKAGFDAEYRKLAGENRSFVPSAPSLIPEQPQAASSSHR